MTDDQLRALVRAAVTKHLGRSDPSMSGPVAPPMRSVERPSALAIAPSVAAEPHPSHAVYLALVNTSDACVIEPAVPCNHCNYCRSHGH